MENLRVLHNLVHHVDRMAGENDARVWLRANGYDDVADDIDKLMEGWRKRGSKTRRNWWQALGGTDAGGPRTIEGIIFPVLAAVRHRNGLPPVKDAVKNPGETAPAQVPQVRWEKKPRRRRSAKAK